MQRCDVLVLGGGVAGAALAYHLGRAGVRAAVLERHAQAGVHASGRNAGLVLQSVAEPQVRALVAASAREYGRRAGEVGFDPCGSLLLGAPELLATLREPAHVTSRLVTAAAAQARVPLLAGHRIAAALETPGDGVLDPHRLLAWYLDAAGRNGVRVVFGAAATAIVGSAPIRVETSAGTWQAERVVDARGAWAGSALAAAAIEPAATTLGARKRHLFLLAHRLPSGQPFVWDLEHGFYFRAEGEATLACMCDEELTATLDETVGDDAEGRLRRVLAPHLPALAAAPLVRAWACFRTRAPDGLPLLGPDPRDASRWWLAGLGGHGLSSSWELGRLVAAALVDGPAVLPAALCADRPSLSRREAPARPPAPRRC